jgi:hypothetical protein
MRFRARCHRDRFRGRREGRGARVLDGGTGHAEEAAQGGKEEGREDAASTGTGLVKIEIY